MKKRILIFSTAYYPFVGGAEVAVREIAKRCEGIDFFMITAKMDRSLPRVENIENILVYRFGIGNPKLDKILLAIFGGFYAVWLNRKYKADLIWSIMASYNSFAAILFKQLSKIPMLLTLQEGDPIEYILNKVRFVRWRFDQIFVKADYLQAISNYLLEWGKQMGFKKDGKVIPNGVDILKFVPKEEYCKERSKEIIVKELSLRNIENIKFIITVSRLVKKNGVADLINSIKLLPQNYHLLVAGIGELEENLRSLVKKLDLVDRVHFVGNKNHNELVAYLWGSDIFCRPSITEGLGNVFLEAMAAGLPVIGTKVGGIPDIIKPGETGLFCEVNNPESIAEKVLYLENDKVLKEKLIKNGQKMVLVNYSWDIIADKMRENYFSL